MAKQPLDRKAIYVDRVPTPEHNKLQIGVWLVTGPFHPFWNQWMVSIAHLREVPGVKPPLKHRESATHELVIVALKPEDGTTSSQYTKSSFEEALETREPLPFLTPIDLVHQFAASSDADALSIVEPLMAKVRMGMLSPDQDFRQAWMRSIDRLANNDSRQEGNQ